MSENSFDVVVIGGGPGGYVAAIRAAQLGLKSACIEKDEALGGTCLNVGCIPSKALLHTSEQYEEAGHGLEKHGVIVGDLKLDLDAMMDHKDETVETLTKGVAHLFKKNKVARLRGTARITGKREITVSRGAGDSEVVKAGKIVIATGSESMALPGVEIDEERIVSSTGALDLKRVPKHLVVIGAGYIGLELGSVWRRLGAKVTVVELLDTILPGMDRGIAKEFQRILGSQGMVFKLETKVTRAVRKGKKVTLGLEPARGGNEETLEADVVLVAVGRRPFTRGLGLDEAGVAHLFKKNKVARLRGTA
ncbi:MAG: NAD(P)/FAD-dependent oxidoreductase, partial [Alphaproteobacteria bacterium]